VEFIEKCRNFTVLSDLSTFYQIANILRLLPRRKIELMLNFEFRPSSKKCSATDRMLLPGEEFFSALIERGDDLQRLDFSLEAWQGPPEQCIGWWKSTIPVVRGNKIYWAPRKVLLAYFEHVRQQVGRADVAYVMALLLVQKKILSLDDILESAGSQSLHLRSRQENLKYQVPVVDIPPARVQQIQDELAVQLFSDQPYADVDVGESDEEEID
jgi:hypothetical protein